MDSERDLDISNARALIALWQEEEQRLHGVLSEPLASSEIKSQAKSRLEFVLNQIRDAADELEKLSRT